MTDGQSGDSTGGAGNVGVAGRRAVLVLVCLFLSVVSAATAIAFVLTMPSTAAQRGAEQTADRDNRLAAMQAWWRTVPLSLVFPPQLTYTDASGVRQQMTRIGVAPAAGCDAVLDTIEQAAITPAGCAGVLRGAYTDETQTYVTTLAVVAVDAAPGSPVLVAYDRAVATLGDGASGDGAAVTPVAYPGTAAATAPPGVASYHAATPAIPYEVIAVTAFSDGRTGGLADGQGATAGVGVLTANVGEAFAGALNAEVGGAAG